MNFKKLMKYSAKLQKHNERTWFHENHEEYENAKKDFYSFLDEFRYRLADEVPSLGDSIKYMEPKEWAYRIARDMRFHKNGPPYNPAFRAYIAPEKKSRQPVGYYIRLCPGSCCFGTGVWCETTAQMNNIRKYISKNYDEFNSILKKGVISVGGVKLKNVPKGFSKDDPAAEYLKNKSWDVMVYIPDEDVTTFEEVSDLLIFYVRLMEPMRQFLLKASSYVDNERPEFEW